MVDLVRDRADPARSAEGVWADIRDFGRVKIRRWNNKEYRDAALKLRGEKLEELKMLPTADLPDEHTFGVMVQAACEHVIVDWEGIESEGMPVPYTPEVGIETFAEEEGPWRDEFNLIVNAASDRSKYALERIEDNTKKH